MGQGSLPTPGPTRPAPPPPSAPTSALQLWLLPPLLSPLPRTTTSMCLQLLSPPPSRSLLLMSPSLPTTPTPTLTGTRSPRAPIWRPSPRRQTPPSRRLTLPSQPSRELSIFVLWGHYYQIKTRQYL